MVVLKHTTLSNQQSSSSTSTHTPGSLFYAVSHVIFPGNAPEGTYPTVEKDFSLVHEVSVAAHAYTTRINGSSEPHWNRIKRMLDNLKMSVQFEYLDVDHIISQLREMRTGDVLSFLIQSHNSGILLTKRETNTMFETFDLSSDTTVPLLLTEISYPKSAVELPNHVFINASFQLELANFLSRCYTFHRDHNAFVTSLHNDVLLRYGHPAHIPLITKRFRNRFHRRHRSRLWSSIKVVIEMSLDRSSHGRQSYKSFMLFFLCNLANDANVNTLYSDLLHLMACKLQRRLTKLGSSIPDWLFQLAQSTLAHLSTRFSSFQNPSQAELERDTELSLACSQDYIRNALANHKCDPLLTTFSPSYRRRGTIHDFLSSSGDVSLRLYDDQVTLYDVEKAVEEDIDDWIANVKDVQKACSQLETLMDAYMTKARSRYEKDTISQSIMLLTGIELFIALDKLVLKDIPMLANYSPEVPATALESLFPHNQTSLHRLSRAYQYLTARQSESRMGWSVVSDEDCLPVRYYDQSPHLHQLNARIVQGATSININVGDGQLEDQPSAFVCRLYTLKAEGAQLPLPVSPLHAKVFVFELQCPACIRIWRSAAARMLCFFQSPSANVRIEKETNLLRHAPAWRQYYVQGDGLLPAINVQFAYSYPAESYSSPTLYYAVEDSQVNRIWIWEGNKHPEHWQGWWNKVSEHYTKYAKGIVHSPNDVLAAQASCPANISLDEFLVSGQLRSGGSLQWVNILHGLRSRTLNLRHDDVYYLLSCSVSQVGPLDPDTGMWLWHEELQDSSFCNALLDELEDLTMDTRAQVIDGVMMKTISSLLTRMLASSPGEGVFQRVLALLWRVRRKILDWVHELAYNLGKQPANLHRMELLYDMSDAYLSTFDVDTTSLSKQFHSTEDITGALSCILLTSGLDRFVRRFLYSRHLSITFEKALSHAILSDATDRGIDLAVCMFFPGHKPGTTKWIKLQHPNAHWFTCLTRESVDKPSRTAHLNLLDGELQIDGQSMGTLYGLVQEHFMFREVSADQGFFILPQMDPLNEDMMPKQKMHFFLRDGSLMVHLHHSDSKDILEWIPSGILKYDLPPPLLDGHVHWLNLSKGILEIRPLQRPLSSSPEDWRIDFSLGQFRAYKGNETLVDIRSLTWAMISHCFKCLNILWERQFDNEVLVRESNNLLITTFPIKSLQSMLRLSVLLPRHGLSFFINDQGDLESRDFKHMVYDKNPQVGTLSGISYLFVLKQKPGLPLPEGFMHRRILVPDAVPTRCYGPYDPMAIRFKGGGSSDGSTYHFYDVDTEMGCLLGNGSLRSTRQLAYMHAATGRRRDPLMGKTGIEAAVSLLRSGGCRSIAKFKSLEELTSHPELWVSTNFKVDMAHKDIQERYYWKRSSRASGPSDAERRSLNMPLASISRLPTPFKSIPYEIVNQRSRSCSKKERQRHFTLYLLFSNRPAPELPPRGSLLRDSHKNSSNNFEELHRFFSSLEANKSRSSFHQEYIARLRADALHMRKEPWHVSFSPAGSDGTDALKNYFEQCRITYFKALEILKETLSAGTDPLEKLDSRRGLWPPITGDSLLRCLTSTSEEIPRPWKKCLVSLAIRLLDLQRARRLIRFALDDIEEEFSKELGNEVCDGWDPEEYPDWLLIQIQGNFLIRRNQAKVAMETISPKPERNSVMQVNMGEGKSSVIIPIAAAALADGKQLVRIIVPKALTVQMFDLLVSRLGGLVNRPVYHLPFSRTLEHDTHGKTGLELHDTLRLMQQCMAERGILLMQPEHLTSLKLMCIEKQLCMNSVANPSSKVQRSSYEHIRDSVLLKLLPMEKVGSMLQRSRSVITRQCDEQSQDGSLSGMSFHKWMNSNVRDILDESDEILHSRFQLIYTVGLEQHMEGYPERWTITQQVLRFLKECTSSLESSFQIKCGPPGSFPHISTVSDSYMESGLKPLIVEYVMAGRFRNLNFRDLPRELRDAIHSFISVKDVLPGTVKRVQDFARDSDEPCTWSALLLLRGLLALDILLFALVERRWRVDYGLVFESPFSNKTPTLLAVPYRAKDKPAPNTQFGHPDVTIILTCLSYYYSGLSKEQLRTSFELLLEQDNPHGEYALWVKDYTEDTLPESLRTLGEINLRSSELWDNIIFPLFTRNQAAVDLYLSRVVFPRESKEFPFKLSASSWDLTGKREKVVTGFSGTDDGRWLLPMSIDQRDLDHQRGTNARVLAHLLQPENDFYIPYAHENNKGWSTTELLRTVANQQPEIRVLLDVGAQILESSNHRVVNTWLDIDRDAAGAVYFNEEDELTVLMRNGVSVPMSSSSLSQQLGRCVVYLDHAHTKGTDLKLPVGSRAAVTLGPRLTKDWLVQGCMRMRKLGRGHSVMFFAPPEVDMSIRALKKDPNSRITTVDILCWAIHETWVDIQQRAPYWAQQGMDYRSREDAWSRFCHQEMTSKQLSDSWLQPAARSLEDLYAPRECNQGSSTLLDLDSDIQQRCRDLGVTSLSCVQVEEQEREVDREREREWESERPPKAEPAEHFLHPDVVDFVKTGVIPALYSSNAFRPIFTTLTKSSAVTRDADVWSPSILATADFCNTIIPESTKGSIDQYLRPVQWVVSSQRDRVLVLMSPFEVNLLIREFRASEDVHLHLYTPRTSLRMKPSDDLKLYTIPPLPLNWTPPWDLMDQLNVFSGQLYLRNYPSYLRLCRFLQVPAGDSPNDAVVRRNLFNIPGSFEDQEITFSSSPLYSLMALLAIRSRGRPLSHTHMGRIFYGQLLRPDDFLGCQLGASRLSEITCGKQRADDAASSSSMDVDSPGGPGPSYKRKRKSEKETFNLGESERVSKRLRFD